MASCVVIIVITITNREKITQNVVIFLKKRLEYERSMFCNYKIIFIFCKEKDGMSDKIVQSALILLL